MSESGVAANGASGDRSISVLCVDDNPDVGEALRIKLSRTPGFLWMGHVLSADELIERAAKDCPMVVLVDIDMPGKDPFEAVSELPGMCPDSRALMFSGHVRRELLDRALDAGAWGYISKNDGEEELIRCLRAASAGEFVMSPEVQRMHDAR